jgi:hypothetical protein
MDDILLSTFGIFWDLLSGSFGTSVGPHFGTPPNQLCSEIASLMSDWHSRLNQAARARNEPFTMAAKDMKFHTSSNIIKSSLWLRYAGTSIASM